MPLDHDNEWVDAHEEEMSSAANPEAMAGEGLQAFRQPDLIASGHKPCTFHGGKHAIICFEREYMI